MNILKNWRVSDSQLMHRLVKRKIDKKILKTKPVVIVGNVYGDSRFNDGGEVFTTAIRTIERTDNAYIATTEHGTQYLLPDSCDSPLPAAMIIQKWQIVFNADTRDKFVRKFKDAFVDLVMSDNTIPNGGDYAIKNFAMPLDFGVACTILKKKTLLADLNSVYKFTLKGGETRYYFESAGNYVEFHLEDWSEEQAADFGIII